jgi:hypothetical protein
MILEGTVSSKILIVLLEPRYSRLGVLICFQLEHLMMMTMRETQLAGNVDCEALDPRCQYSPRDLGYNNIILLDGDICRIYSRLFSTPYPHDHMAH